jgi:hypothetical protein
MRVPGHSGLEGGLRTTQETFLFPDGRNDTVFMIELQKFGQNMVTDLPLISPTSFNYQIEPIAGWRTSIAINNTYFDASPKT